MTNEQKLSNIDILSKTIESIEVDTNESGNFISMASINKTRSEKLQDIKVVDSIDLDNSVFNDTESVHEYVGGAFTTSNHHERNILDDNESCISDDEINAYLGEKRRQDVPLLSGDNGVGDIVISYKETELANKKYYTRIIILVLITILLLLLGCFLLLLVVLFR